MTPRALEKLIAPLKRRVALMIGRGVVRRADDGGGRQVLQVGLLAGETRSEADHVQPYGFTFHPLDGAEAILVFPAGDRSHGIAVVVGDRRYRLTGLAPGEVALHDDQGQKIVLHRDRIEVTAPKVVVVSDDVQLGADGGPRVARIGDLVDVASGSSAGQWPIVSGAAKVSAA